LRSLHTEHPDFALEKVDVFDNVKGFMISAAELGPDNNVKQRKKQREEMALSISNACPILDC
jgi:hypothetical protein